MNEITNHASSTFSTRKFKHIIFCALMEIENNCVVFVERMECSKLDVLTYNYKYRILSRYCIFLSYEDAHVNTPSNRRATTHAHHGGLLT